MLHYTRQVRGELLSAPIPLMPWVQPANSSWYSKLCRTAPCGTNKSSLAYDGQWAEMLFHMGLNGISEFLWYRAGDEYVTEGIGNFTRVLEELDTVTGRVGGKVHCLQTVVSWADVALISGIESAVGSIFRLSPRNMSEVIVDSTHPASFRICGKKVTPVPDGKLLDLPHSFGTHGFWISTVDKSAKGSTCKV